MKKEIKEISCMRNYDDDYAWQGKIIVNEDKTFEGILFDNNRTYIVGKFDKENNVSFVLFKKEGKDIIDAYYKRNDDLVNVYKGKYYENNINTYSCDVFLTDNQLDDISLNNLIACTNEAKRLRKSK